ncbi:MAG: uroporphyrinogen decarboxylase family protein [Promethearchaeota archaeon]
MMDSRDRIMAVLNGEIPDRVPYLELDMASHEIGRYYGVEYKKYKSITKLKWMERLPGWRKLVKKLTASDDVYVKLLFNEVEKYRKLKMDALPMPISFLPIKNRKPTAKMDIFQLKKDNPNLTFIGNVSPQDLQDKTPEFIRDYTTRLMTECKKGGRFILSSGHSINPAVDLENYLVMRDVHEKLGKY